MGNVVKKNENEEVRKEYFKIIKNNFDEGIKKINTAVHSQYNAENWVKYLENRLCDYFDDKDKKLVHCVKLYLKNMSDTDDAKHLYNLNIFLAKETDNEYVNKYNKSIFFNIDLLKSFNSLGKDDLMSKAIIFIFEDIENVDNPLHVFIQYFRFILCISYEKMFLKNEDKIEIIYIHLLNELMDVSSFLTDALILFYDIRKTTTTKFYQIYYNKIRDVLFRKDLYKLLFTYKRRIIYEEDELYNYSLIQYYNIKPSQLAINPYFCEDEIFMKSVLNRLGKDDVEVIPSVFSFYSSVLKYRRIAESDSILKKIDQMYELRANILTEIDHTWKGVPLHPSLKQVDANNFQSIFIYIVIKGQVDSMYTEVRLIDDILSDNSKLSEKGYFYTLLLSAMEYIMQSINQKILDNFEKEYNALVEKETNSDLFCLN
jgi:hypothetical protein